MTNTFMLLGRLSEILKDKKVIKISVNRAYKNENGEYETDIIPITLKGTLLNNLVDYCKVGDFIAIKGSIEYNFGIELIAEKLTFLSSGKEEE